MKIIIAPDSFKGSLSALEVAKAMETGIKKAIPESKTILLPMADGGEGTMEALVASTGGKKFEAAVQGPLGQTIHAEYGCLGDGTTCVIEMAAASGLCLISHAEQNPLLTTTYGTGQLIKHALDQGFRRFIIGIGGSATNDGGAGMLQALGLKLLDNHGKSVAAGGDHLRYIQSIEWSDWDERICGSQFTLANDVHNPLLGPNGASFIYGPQKGASPFIVEQLESSMEHWADVMWKETGNRMHDMPGAGAGGGIAAAFKAFFSARFNRGVDIVIEHTGLKLALDGADFVITGEGRVDNQTASGKTPLGVAQEAQKCGIPVFILAGSIGQGIEELYPCGVTSVHSIVDGPMKLEDAVDRTRELLTLKAEQIARTFQAGRVGHSR
jgi:glycerate kinase